MQRPGYKPKSLFYMAWVFCNCLFAWVAWKTVYGRCLSREPKATGPVICFIAMLTAEIRSGHMAGCCILINLWGTCLIVHIGRPAWSILRTPATGWVSLSEGRWRSGITGWLWWGCRWLADRTLPTLQLVLHQLPRLLVLFDHPCALHLHQSNSLEELTLRCRHCSVFWSFASSFLPTHWRSYSVTVFQSSDWLYHTLPHFKPYTFLNV